MKRLKIAVCLSGQPRSWQTALPYLKNFYKSDLHDIYFFGHAWDQNDWKKPGHETNWAEPVIEKLDAELLKRDLESHIKFEKLVVESQVFSEMKKIKNRHQYQTTWAPMFKSCAMAMNLKTQFEIENNMVFDLVFRARFDVAYHPTENVEYYIPREICPDAVYVNLTNFDIEFRMPLINDIAYYGSSRAMSIVDSFHFYYQNGRFLEMMNYSELNPAYNLVGPGVLLYKWITMKNIKMYSPPFNRFLNPVPIRQFAQGGTYPGNYQSILEAYAPPPPPVS